MYRISRLRSTLNTNVITGSDRFGHVSSMTQKCEKRSPFFTGLDMCHISDKTKTLRPVGRMLSLGPWPRVLPKPYETMFNMQKNKRLLWGAHDQKRARPRTRKEQPGAQPFIAHITTTLPNPQSTWPRLDTLCIHPLTKSPVQKNTGSSAPHQR